MHRRARVPEIEAQVLGQRPDGRLTGIVRGVAGRVRDALLAARDHDGRRRIGRRAGLKRRDEGVQPVDHAEQVGREYLSRPWSAFLVCSPRHVIL